MTATPDRHRLYARLHRAAKAAGYDEARRRALMAEATGKTSAKELSDSELEALARQFEQAAGPSRRRADTPHARLCRALWLSLWHLGVIRDPAERALAAFVKRQHGVDDLRFVAGREAAPVIEGLKAMAARAGADWGRWPGMPAETRGRYAVLAAQWGRLKAAGALPAGDLAAWTEHVVGRVSPAICTAAELDQLIRSLGPKVRAVSKAVEQGAK
jgi:hypothetical protein